MKTHTLRRFAVVFGSLLSAAASHAQILFQSDLNSSTGWTIVQETPSSLATFGYDYSVVGIPPSPNGGGTTLGLRLAANNNTSVQAITAATTATFSGQFRVTFDFWGNTNGPLPGGGNGFHRIPRRRRRIFRDRTSKRSQLDYNDGRRLRCCPIRLAAR
jgi:hypothetical protein